MNNTDLLIEKIEQILSTNQPDFNSIIRICNNEFDKKNNDSRLFFFCALSFHQVGNIPLAKRFYNLAVNKVDTHSKWSKELSSHNLSLIYFEEDDYLECIECLRHNAEHAKEKEYFANANYLMAHCLYLLGKQNSFNPIGRVYLLSSIDHINKATTLYPEKNDYLVIAGMIHLENFNRESAIQYLEKAAKNGDYEASRILQNL